MPLRETRGRLSRASLKSSRHQQRGRRNLPPRRDAAGGAARRRRRRRCEEARGGGGAGERSPWFLPPPPRRALRLFPAGAAQVTGRGRTAAAARPFPSLALCPLCSGRFRRAPAPRWARPFPLAAVSSGAEWRRRGLAAVVSLPSAGQRRRLFAGAFLWHGRARTLSAALRDQTWGCGAELSSCLMQGFRLWSVFVLIRASC